MTHDLFGKLKYKDGDESWAGSAQLPRFAATGLRPEPPEMTEEEAQKAIADMNAALEGMREMMHERFGDRAAAAFAEIDREADEQLRKAEEEPNEPDPKEEAHEQKRAERRKKHAALLAKGKFPIRVAGPNGAEPTPQQEAAFRFLQENEPSVYDAVIGQVWESFRYAYDQEYWRQMAGLQPASSIADLAGKFAVTRLDISREARAGFAHLAFLVDAEWEDDHGLLVVHSPDTRETTWTTWDGLFDLLESDEPEPAGAEFVPTPHDELLEAILTGDESKARELIAAGADINALGPDEYPPLWIAVDQMEVDEVRRLLAFGADPNLVNGDEKSTPLRHAKKMYRDMGFAPSKKKDEAFDNLMEMMKEAVGKQYDELKTRLETIIKLLSSTELGARSAELKNEDRNEE
jgi:hypothetical protein